MVRRRWSATAQMRLIWRATIPGRLLEWVGEGGARRGGRGRHLWVSAIHVEPPMSCSGEGCAVRDRVFARTAMRRRPGRSGSSARASFQQVVLFLCPALLTAWCILLSAIGRCGLIIRCMGELPTGTITMLFSDVEGSTALLSRLGDRYGEALSAQRAIQRADTGRW